MRQRYPLATPRELPFLDAYKIMQRHLSIREVCQRGHGHEPIKRTHGVAELRHSVDGNVESSPLSAA